MGMRLSSGAAVVAAAVFALTTISSPVFAQIEEITVTARKTEESLQDVPLSIAAFTAEQMRERGIFNNYDVATFTPNFTTTQRVGRTLDRPTIRGMTNPGTRGEPNASYFIDGTFVAGSISTATTQSMERVEVLRGPQSATFGRATFSGAVNYVTRKPSDEFDVRLNAALRYARRPDARAAGSPVRCLPRRCCSCCPAATRSTAVNGTTSCNRIPLHHFATAYRTPIRWKTYSAIRTARVTIRRSAVRKRPTYPDETDVSAVRIDDDQPVKYSFTRGEDGHFPNNVYSPT